MKRLIYLLLLASAFAQIPTKVRSTLVLPSTCNPGNGILSADHIDLFGAGSNTPYYCLSQNVWGQVTSGPGNFAGLGTNNGFSGTNSFSQTTSFLGNINSSATALFGNLNAVEVVDGNRNINISAAISHLPVAGGIVKLPSHYRETITNHIDLGGGVGVSSVLIKADADVIITCNVTDGSYCFGIHTSSGLSGTEPWANTGASFQITGSATMNVTNMVKNLDLPQASIILEKVWISDNASAPPTNACFLLDSIGNMAIVRDDTIVCKGAIGWLIQSTSGFTGPFTMDNVWSLPGGNFANSVPCEILDTGNSLVGIVLLGGACNDAGAGKPSLLINGNGHIGALRGINVENYDETLCGNNNETGIQITDAWDVHVHGVVVACNGSGGTGNNGIGISQSGAGGAREIVIDASQFQASGSGGCVINNTITGECGPANINTQNNIGYYKYSGDSSLTSTVFIGGSDFRIYNSTGGGTFNTEFVLNNSAAIFTPPLLLNQLGQNNAHTWADSATCSSNAKTVTFSTAYNSAPIVVVSDDTTVGGVKVTSRSASQFVVACTGATDIFEWIAVGNPN